MAIADPQDAADTSAAQEALERARDRFVWWTNGLLILLVLGILVVPALNWVEIAP